jgi:hypothetical protein
MIKIGYEKLFSQTELLENLKEYLKVEAVADLKAGKCDFEICAVAVVIGESADFVRGYLTK